MRYRRFYTGQIIERRDELYRYKILRVDFFNEVICIETGQHFFVSLDSLIVNSNGKIFLENFL